MIVDLLMTILMLVCMAYQLTGNFAHEVLGMVLLVVFILHHILNRHWYGALSKGRYRKLRVMLTLTNAVLLVFNTADDGYWDCFIPRFVSAVSP